MSPYSHLKLLYPDSEEMYFAFINPFVFSLSMTKLIIQYLKKTNQHPSAECCINLIKEKIKHMDIYELFKNGYSNKKTLEYGEIRQQHR